MQFEYFTFEVEPYLQSGNQPSFVWRDVKPSCNYHTLTDLEKVETTLTTNNSDGVRIPVHAVATSPPEEQSQHVKQLGHGSLLFAMGMEHAMRAIRSVDADQVIERVILVIATNCHELTGQRYRAYFGLSIETRK